MESLEERAQQNGIEYTRLSKSQLRSDEPNIAGLGALLVHATGIVDYSAVCRAMAERIEVRGGEIRRGVEATAIAEEDGGVRIASATGRIEARRLIACAGLQSDRIALMAGLSDRPPHRSVPGRILRVAGIEGRYGQAPHLPHSRPGPAFPRHSPDPDDRRRHDRRPQCGAGLCPRGLPEGQLQSSGRCGEHGGVSPASGKWRRRTGVRRLRNSPIRHRGSAICGSAGNTARRSR